MKVRTFRQVFNVALLLAVTTIVTVVLPACETVQGAGRDVQNVGAAGQRAIDGSSSSRNHTSGQ